jgi:hypothetical protein
MTLVNAVRPVLRATATYCISGIQLGRKRCFRDSSPTGAVLESVNNIELLGRVFVYQSVFGLMMARAYSNDEGR